MQTKDGRVILEGTGGRGDIAFVADVLKHRLNGLAKRTVNGPGRTADLVEQLADRALLQDVCSAQVGLATDARAIAIVPQASRESSILGRKPVR